MDTSSSARHDDNGFQLKQIHLAISSAILTMTMLGSTAQAQQTGTSSANDDSVTLPAVSVSDTALSSARELPEPYSGGQVAKGGRVGILGNRDVMDTPFNVTHFTSELIENQQAQTIADVLANDPSVRVEGNSLTGAGGAGDRFFVRGFEVRGQDVAFEGVYGIAPARMFPVETAERVELLKGTNALLNGIAPSGSLGGSINIIPKRAKEQPITRLTASYESDALFGGHLDVGRRFGEGSEWGVRFNGIYRDGDTAVDDQSSELNVGTLSVDYAGERLRVTLDAGYQKVRIENPTPTFYFDSGFALPGPPDADQRIAQTWEYGRYESDYLLTRVEYDLTPNWTVYAAAGFSHNTEESLQTDFYPVLDRQGNVTATVYFHPFTEDRESVQGGLFGRIQTGAIQHEMNINYSTVEREWGYNGGIYYGFTDFDTNIYEPSTVPRPSTAGFSSNPPKWQELRTPTFAIADTLTFAEGVFSLTLGVRHQTVEVDEFNAGVKDSKYDESETTPAVALVFKPKSNVSIYANYMEGLSQGPTAPIGTENSDEVFPPIETKQIEAGVKFDLGSFATTASLFQIEKPEGIRVADNAGGLPTYKIDGEQRNRGVEVNLFGEVAPGLRVLGGVTYIDARLTRTEDGAFDDNVAVGVPDWQVNLGTEWDVTAVPGMTLSARVLYTDSQYEDRENTRSIPSWTRWDIGAKYATRAFEHPVVLRAGIENLFDKNYWNSTADGALSLASPRTFTLSASVDF